MKSSNSPRPLPLSPVVAGRISHKPKIAQGPAKIGGFPWTLNKPDGWFDLSTSSRIFTTTPTPRLAVFGSPEFPIYPKLAMHPDDRFPGGEPKLSRSGTVERPSTAFYQNISRWIAGDRDEFVVRMVGMLTVTGTIRDETLSPYLEKRAVVHQKVLRKLFVAIYIKKRGRQPGLFIHLRRLRDLSTLEINSIRKETEAIYSSWKELLVTRIQEQEGKDPESGGQAQGPRQNAEVASKAHQWQRKLHRYQLKLAKHASRNWPAAFRTSASAARNCSTSSSS